MKVIITGTTGMVGESVLLECLNNPIITEVLSVSRKPAGKQHPKLKEYIVPDFGVLNENDENLQGYDACFFCAGTTSMGMNEEQYRRITYDTTIHFAKVLNPNPALSFTYITASGTDSEEKAHIMWKRVKGKTENDLMKLPFKQAFAFRIGFVIPAAGHQYALKFYKYVSWLFPLMYVLFPNLITTAKQIADAMIYVSRNGYESNIIHVKDIRKIEKILT